MSYFIVSVSNKTNLELCLRHALAGFPNSYNGLWAYFDIEEGDYLSFLYGARLYNLYQVKRKEAIENAGKIGPWPISPKGGRYFPYRLNLSPILKIDNLLIIKDDFEYMAENLFSRGGYNKTHFQADNRTFQAISNNGVIYDSTIEKLELNKYETFIPKITFLKDKDNLPQKAHFREIYLQTIIRQYLSIKNNLNSFLNDYSKNIDELEVLSEKGFPEGHVDIFIKNSNSYDTNDKFIIEVKTHKAQTKDIEQLYKYIQEIPNSRGFLIAEDIPRNVYEEAVKNRIKCYIYNFEDIDTDSSYSLETLKQKFNLTPCIYSQ